RRLAFEDAIELNPAPPGKRLIVERAEVLAVRALELDAQRDRVRPRVDEGEVRALRVVLLQAEDRRRRRRRPRRGIEQPEGPTRSRRRGAAADEAPWKRTRKVPTC